MVLGVTLTLQQPFGLVQVGDDVAGDVVEFVGQGAPFFSSLSISGSCECCTAVVISWQTQPESGTNKIKLNYWRKYLATASVRDWT